MKAISHSINVELARLVDRLPSQCWHHSNFEFENGFWTFEFECNHTNGTFYSKAVGESAKEAFTVAVGDIERQIDAWHKARFTDEVGNPLEVLNKNSVTIPRVLIVDDDVDAALSMQTALSQLGYHTDIATKAEEAHHLIATTDADYIFLDWKLNNDITAKQVMQRAVRLIDTFSDLRMKFAIHQPRIVTHSVLSRSQINMPSSASRYFIMLDHWQKPLRFQDLVKKASDLFMLNYAYARAA